MGISIRGTKAKSITSCDIAFVTNIVLAREPAAKRMFSVRKRSVNVAAANVLTVRKLSGSNKCFFCAKAKRQLQSAQLERESTTLYGDDHQFLRFHHILAITIAFIPT
ncbi:hypothetical protein LAV73_02935 [Lysinibacillus xylanilyticus]|uniref:hypothetical protein n=1 Tax=Lysinibacillus xylanilyticus TaxID=582475 RepID=UPI002B24DF04|nr:hypothetical protein [Lysinibacillus xylanilyticus]MEB2278958.1 hypothetical protein [Lysinibacillus xylanilyticus]